MEASPLQRLPPALRVVVSEYLLIAERPLITCQSGDGRHRLCQNHEACGNTSRIGTTPSTGLLRTCKQMAAECTGVMYSANTFQIWFHTSKTTSFLTSIGDSNVKYLPAVEFEIDAYMDAENWYSSTREAITRLLLERSKLPSQCKATLKDQGVWIDGTDDTGDTRTSALLHYDLDVKELGRSLGNFREQLQTHCDTERRNDIEYADLEYTDVPALLLQIARLQTFSGYRPGAWD